MRYTVYFNKLNEYFINKSTVILLKVSIQTLIEHSYLLSHLGNMWIKNSTKKSNMNLFSSSILRD